MLSIIFIACVIIFSIAYKIYGNFLSKNFEIDSSRQTPAHAFNDGVDYVPTRPAIVFGHHFASIAGAGPIVGPIIATLYFGWLPVILWIVVGSIFIGGLHDYGAIVASIRHDGKSIAEIARKFLGPEIYYILLAFILITIEYVLIVFADITATTFVSNGAVACSAVGYILLASIFGLILYKFKSNLFITSIPFIILLFVMLYIGYVFPIGQISILGMDTKQSWQIILLGYCFVASILPMWLLLQPRDYLSSFLLYFAIIVAFVGLIFLHRPIEFPAFIPFLSRTKDISLFPSLFIIVACGAVSGFHSLVSSGTTAKQIGKEHNAKIIGYGGMLIEGVVAVIAVATVMMLPLGNASKLGNPLVIFSHGIGNFLGILGIKGEFARTTGLLIISTFILTTLDTATRISRYIFEELTAGFKFSKKLREHKYYRFFSTFVVLIMPIVFTFLKIKDKATGKVIPAWKAIWPLFGATNQLMAALTLIVLIAWLGKQYNKKVMFIKLPALVMLFITLVALVTYLITSPVIIIKITAFVLILLALRVLHVSLKRKAII